MLNGIAQKSLIRAFPLSFFLRQQSDCCRPTILSQTVVDPNKTHKQTNYVSHIAIYMYYMSISETLMPVFRQ